MTETIKPGPDPIDFRVWELTEWHGALSDAANVIKDLAHERDEAIRQLDNANRINNEMTEANTRLTRENAKLKTQAPIELTSQRDQLSEAIGGIQFVVALQHDLLKETGSLARAADIRRRQIAKGYTLEHDRQRGGQLIAQAGAALANGHESRWPWDHEQFVKLYRDPDRLLHAAALLCAAQDVIDAEDDQ